MSCTLLWLSVDCGGELIMVKLRWIYGKALVLVLYFTGIFLKQQAEALYDALVKRATRLKGLFANFSRLLQTSVVQFFSRLLSCQSKVGQIAPCWLVLLELIVVCVATNHICRSEWQKFVFIFFLNTQVYIRYWQQSENTWVQWSRSSPAPWSDTFCTGFKSSHVCRSTRSICFSLRWQNWADSTLRALQVILDRNGSMGYSK